MLTYKQHELLKFIQLRLEESGVSPSFEEMKEAIGIKSKSGVQRLISALEERGFIRKLPFRARALEVLRQPDQGSHSALAKFSTAALKAELAYRAAEAAASDDLHVSHAAAMQQPGA